MASSRPPNSAMAGSDHDNGQVNSDRSYAELQKLDWFLIYAFSYLKSNVDVLIDKLTTK
jgi:hypothetical protein